MIYIWNWVHLCIAISFSLLHSLSFYHLNTAWLLKKSMKMCPLSTVMLLLWRFEPEEMAIQCNVKTFGVYVILVLLCRQYIPGITPRRLSVKVFQELALVAAPLPRLWLALCSSLWYVSSGSLWSILGNPPPTSSHACYPLSTMHEEEDLSVQLYLLVSCLKTVVPFIIQSKTKNSGRALRDLLPFSVTWWIESTLSCWLSFFPQVLCYCIF